MGVLEFFLDIRDNIVCGFLYNESECLRDIIKINIVWLFGDGYYYSYLKKF